MARNGYKSIALTPEAIGVLKGIQESLCKDLGFEPTLAQMMQFLILKYKQGKEGANAEN